MKDFVKNKTRILTGALVIGIFLFVQMQNQESTVYLYEPNNTLPIISIETTEVSKEDMIATISEVEKRIEESSEEMEQTFHTVKREERIANETFDCIVKKRMEFLFDDLVIEVEAFFDVDSDSKKVKDTLFAWSMPKELNERYTQAYILDVIAEYPIERAHIRVRGIYLKAEETTQYMNLYYEVD